MSVRPTYAIIRNIPPTISSGLVLDPTTPETLSYPVAQSQHDIYASALTPHVTNVTRLPSLPDYPDSCFVEDTAVLIPPLAVLTQPGHPSRRGEMSTVLGALQALPSPPKEIIRMTGDACADGGDVLLLGTHLVIGLSRRTNDAGAKVLCGAAEKAGIKGVVVGCLRTRLDNLHLKCVITAVNEDTLVVADSDIGRQVFEEVEALLERPLQPIYTPSFFYANVVRLPPLVPLPESATDRANVNGKAECILVQAVAPAELKAELAQHVDEVKDVDMTELGKVDGALTCCSLLWRP